MRNPERLDKFYDELKRLHKKYIPDWRFGQFMVNFLSDSYDKTKVDPFFYEENKTLELLHQFFGDT